VENGLSNGRQSRSDFSRSFPAITSRRATCCLSAQKHRLHCHGDASKICCIPEGTGRDLSAEIDLLLNEPDPRKATPYRLRETIDAIRNSGNLSAHPIDDKTALQVIDVEPHEAEWCLEILEECFQHFYVGPAVAKARKIAVDEKLALAGKPPSKS